MSGPALFFLALPVLGAAHAIAWIVTVILRPGRPDPAATLPDLTRPHTGRPPLRDDQVPGIDGYLLARCEAIYRRSRPVARARARITVLLGGRP